MDDATFGRIEYDYDWRGEYSYSIFGNTYKVELVIPCDEGEDFESDQRQAFDNFRRDEANLVKLAQRAIYEHYLDIVDEVRERVGPDRADQVAPRITDEQDMARLVTPTELLVQRSFSPDERIIGLMFDCTWDPGLGLAVKFENEAVAEVGPQDIVL